MTIRNAIDKIAAKYKGGELSWLTENNPQALTQLNHLEARVDAAALTGEESAITAACRAWSGAWLFWIARCTK